MENQIPSDTVYYLPHYLCWWYGAPHTIVWTGSQVFSQNHELFYILYLILEIKHRRERCGERGREKESVAERELDNTQLHWTLSDFPLLEQVGHYTCRVQQCILLLLTSARSLKFSSMAGFRNGQLVSLGPLFLFTRGLPSDKYFSSVPIHIHCTTHMYIQQTNIHLEALKADS